MLFTTKKIRSVDTWSYNTPLWVSSGLNLPFRKTWYQKGYLWVRDMLNEEGNLVLIKEMSEKELKINFLEYEKLKCETSNLNLRQRSNNQFGPYKPYTILIGYKVKGCSKTYNLLIDFDHNIVIAAQNKSGQYQTKKFYIRK